MNCKQIRKEKENCLYLQKIKLYGKYDKIYKKQIDFSKTGGLYLWQQFFWSLLASVPGSPLFLSLYSLKILPVLYFPQPLAMTEHLSLLFCGIFRALQCLPLPGPEGCSWRPPNPMSSFLPHCQPYERRDFLSLLYSQYLQQHLGHRGTQIIMECISTISAPVF